MVIQASLLQKSSALPVVPGGEDMDPDQSHLAQPSYTRRRFITAGASTSAALYLAACGGSSSSSISPTGTTKTSGKVTLNNLFMQQAGYSADDLAGMTQKFEAANPHIKINNTLVAYEA